METKEWRTVDKSTWGDGPWQNEPDKKQWLDEATGYPCLIVRGPVGALCGYVGLPASHPAFEKGYDDVYDVVPELAVHYGLTFSGFCRETLEEGRGICHVTDTHQPTWWLGFDCAHYGDLCPQIRATLLDIANDKILSSYQAVHEFETYKNLSYVTNECRNLAQQLAAVNQADSKTAPALVPEAQTGDQ